MSRSWFQTKDLWWMRAWERVVYAALLSFQFLTRPIPLWSISRGLAWIAGWLTPLVPGPRRRLEENLARVYPEMPLSERRLLMRDTARHFARLGVEYAHFTRFLREARIETRGLQNLEAPRRAGRGVVLVSAHYGNWETLRMAALAAGHPCGIIYRPFNNRLMDAYTVRVIGLAGQPVLHKGQRGMRALHRHVATGGCVLILVDQRNTGAPLLPFLGHPAETVTVAAALALRTGAALVPAVAPRLDDAGRFEARFEPEIPPSDPETMLTAVNDCIAAWIAEDPAQWFWLHRRWKRRSDAAAAERVS